MQVYHLLTRLRNLVLIQPKCKDGLRMWLNVFFRDYMFHSADPSTFQSDQIAIVCFQTKDPLSAADCAKNGLK